MNDPTHEQVLQFVQQKSQPFATTGDVAERFDSVSERTVRERLKDLVEQDRLRSRRIGPHAKVWYKGDQRKSEANLSSPSSLNQ